MGTTTSEIAGRAGVSRGAQVHHFRHKEELVIAALEHICTRRLAELEFAFEELPIGGLGFRLETLIDLMWAAFRGPSFYAWLELLVAGRTEPILRGAVRETSRARGRDRFRETQSRWRWNARCATTTSRIRRTSSSH